MNYEQFICAMLECTKKKLSATEIVEKQEILKNNGVVSVGLAIRRLDRNVAPIIYLEEFYQKYLLGAEIENLCEFLVEKSRSASTAPVCNYEEIMDFRKIHKQVVYKLINAKRNEKLLREVPNLPILDFAIVFYWMVRMGDLECGSVLIRNSHMNLWKLPISVLYQCAKENTPRLCPYVFRPLTEYMEEMAGEMMEESPLYILSNQMGIHGASAILYPGMPGKIYEKLQRKFYLLPSSIHEFLIVPENDFLIPENLRSMVKEVNETQIKEEELLSDHIYYFNGDIVTKM
ncbi:MAG: hypothetical protein IJ024_07490 [Lachnospiraceae bacterium]|nr:hypothetical protein [Lachnospiraceae bacterium]